MPGSVLPVEAIGVRSVFVKDESLNPTNSFKARGRSVAVTKAKRLGATSRRGFPYSSRVARAAISEAVKQERLWRGEEVPMSQAKSAEEVVQEVRWKTRRQLSAEEKIRIVLEGLRGEESVAAPCRREVDARTSQLLKPENHQARSVRGVLSIAPKRSVWV